MINNNRESKFEYVKVNSNFVRRILPPVVGVSIAAATALAYFSILDQGEPVPQERGLERTIARAIGFCIGAGGTGTVLYYIASRRK